MRLVERAVDEGNRDTVASARPLTEHEDGPLPARELRRGAVAPRDVGGVGDTGVAHGPSHAVGAVGVHTHGAVHALADRMAYGNRNQALSAAINSNQWAMGGGQIHCVCPHAVGLLGRTGRQYSMDMTDSRKSPTLAFINLSLTGSACGSRRGSRDR